MACQDVLGAEDKSFVRFHGLAQVGRSGFQALRELARSVHRCIDGPAQPPLRAPQRGGEVLQPGRADHHEVDITPGSRSAAGDRAVHKGDRDPIREVRQFIAQDTDDPRSLFDKADKFRQERARAVGAVVGEVPFFSSFKHAGVDKPPDRPLERGGAGAKLACEFAEVPPALRRAEGECEDAIESGGEDGGGLITHGA